MRTGWLSHHLVCWGENRHGVPGPEPAETSAAVIDIMEEFGDECKRRHGKRIIYPSDEWYLKAGRPIPPAEFYEDFDQLENGVGMMRLFEDEFRAELDRPHETPHAAA